MKHRALTADQEATILRHLLNGYTLGDTAMKVAMTRTRVESVATQYGHPDEDLMRKSLDELEWSTDPAPEGRPEVERAVVGGVAASSRELLQVPLEQLEPDPENLRGDDLGDVDDLAASIDANGLLQPIVARRRGGRLIVLAGHRRLEAVRRLGWETVEVVVTRDMPPQQVVLAMLVENGQREAIDPIEEANALHRLRGDGLTQDQIGARIGRSNAHVSMRLTLLTLPADVQEQVRAGQLPVMQAVEMARQQKHLVEHGTTHRPAAERGWHFGVGHPLSNAAAATCTALEHSKGRRVSGGIACGECWESVIRADQSRRPR